MQERRRGKWSRWLVVHALDHVFKIAHDHAGDSAASVVRRPSESSGSGRAPGHSSSARRARSRGMESGKS
eukprot:15774815-Heterocapsa_arctica.AAC.1